MEVITLKVHMGTLQVNDFSTTHMIDNLDFVCC